MIIPAILIFYAVVVVAIGFLDSRHVKGFDDYVFAGRNRGLLMVTSSTLASIVGASATIGMVNLAYASGFPSFWWLGSGAVGLVAGSLLVAKNIYNLKAYTLADIVDKLLGPWTRRAVSVLIIAAWAGIVAAQYVAAGQLISLLCGLPYLAAMLLTAGFITIYCAMGGQASVLKTDFIQLLFIVAGLGIALWALYGKTGLPAGGLKFELVNEEFPASMVWYMMLIVGSSFVIGPDIFGRLFTARSATVARRSMFISGLLLTVVSFGIVMIGLWAKDFAAIPSGERNNVLPWLMMNAMSKPLGVVLAMGLLSALISSADTCTITAATTFEHDLRGGSSVAGTRMATIAVSIVAVCLAWKNPGIIHTLLVAYSIFNCGVFPALLFAIVFYRKVRLNPVFATAGIIAGGVLGGVSGMTQRPGLAIYAMAGSAIFALFALYKGRRVG